MHMALQAAGLSPDAVDTINAHGTASGAGDVAELEAIEMVFGETAKTLSAASASSSARPTTVRRVASAKPVMSGGLAPVAPRSRRLAELARKSAGGDSARDSTGST